MAENLYRKRPDAQGAGPSIDDIVNKNAMARLKKDPPGQGPKDRKQDRIDDADLVASMAKRLSLLEKDLKAKARELERIQAENESLRSRLQAAEGSAGSSAGAAPALSIAGSSADVQVTHLTAENARLRNQAAQAWKQVADMKTFLNDYGLVWIGEGSSAEQQPQQQHRRSSAGGAPSPSGRDGDGGAGPLPPRPPQGDKGAAPPRRRSYAGDGAAAAAASSAPPDGPDSHAAGPSSSPVLPFNMTKLLARVQELNQVAGDGCGQLVPGGAQAHVLHTPEPVRLTLFKDGLQLHKAPPRPYSDPASTAVLRDILDGYFPAPLRAEFPDGIPIKVVDRTKDSYREALGPVARPGGSGGSGGSNVRSWHDLESGAAESGPVSREQFLAKLPPAVIKNGKVVDIRKDVGKLMGAPTPTNDPSGSASAAHSNANNVSIVQTPANALLTTSQRNHKGPVLPPPSREARPLGPPLRSQSLGREPLAPVAAGAAGVGAPLPARLSAGMSGSAPQPAIATLQVKNEDGSHTFILKLQYHETIGALRKYMDSHRAQQKDGHKSSDYTIHTAFPPRKYDSVHETLEQAGLVPNATLFLRSATDSAVK